MDSGNHQLAKTDAPVAAPAQTDWVFIDTHAQLSAWVAEMHGWLAAWLARHDVGVLLVTHDVEEAVVLGDRVLVLGGAPATVVHEERIALPRDNRSAHTTTAPFIAHKATLLAELGRTMGVRR